MDHGKHPESIETVYLRLRSLGPGWQVELKEVSSAEIVLSKTAGGDNYWCLTFRE